MMSDFNERFAVLDRIEVPDLKPHVRIRRPVSPGPQIPWGRLISGFVALALAGAGAAIATRAFLGGERGAQMGAVPSVGRLAVVVIEGSYIGKGADSIYVLNQDGTGMERVIEGRAPAWSPDGTRIAFRRGNPNQGGGLDTTIYTAKSDGTDVQTVVTGVSGEASGESGPPVWSPDGSLIAFDTLEGMYVVAPDGSGLRRISRYEGDLACYDLQPSWSPDGSRLVFAVLCDGPNEGLWTVGLEGSQRTQLLAPSEEIAELTQPAWSPGRSQIAFVGATPKGGGKYERDIWVMSADGTGARRLTDGSEAVAAPAWSPDGTEIAYWVWNTEKVMVMNADGSDRRPLTAPGDRTCCPAWLPNPASPPDPTPSVTLDADRTSPVLVSPEGRAATVAIAALTQADIHDARGIYFDYGGVKGTEARGWDVHFCLSSPSSGVCSQEEADAIVGVVREGGDLVVLDAYGAFTARQRSRVIGYEEPAKAPPPAELFVPVSLQSGPEGRDLLASVYWTGAIPSRMFSTCHIELLDDQGDIAYRGKDFDQTAPRVEAARDGVFGSYGIGKNVGASDGRVVCSEWRTPSESP